MLFQSFVKLHIIAIIAQGNATYYYYLWIGNKKNAQEPPCFKILKWFTRYRGIFIPQESFPYP